MSSIRQRNGNYQVRYRCLGVARSETFATRKQAELRQREIELQLARDIDPATGFSLKRGQGLPMKDAVALFRDVWAEKGKSPKTLKRYLPFIRLLFVDGHDFATDITPDDIRRFARDHVQRSASSHNNMVSALNTFFKTLKRSGHIERNPAEVLERRSMPQTIPSIYTTDEIADILCEVGANHLPFALFIATTGCRLSEAQNLLWEDVSLPRVVIRHPKERRDKVLVLPAGLARIIETLPHISKYVFATPTGKLRKHSRRLIQRTGRRIERKRWALQHDQNEITAGRDKDFQKHWKSVSGNYTWHKFRHTVATALCQTEPPAIVQQLLGHSSISTTNRYVHASGQSLTNLANGALTNWFQSVHTSCPQNDSDFPKT